ncbi:MAG TPA: hypothetical protein VH678_07390 [Xanthobacteraceae bacterium]|jgi:hypothetical protein
MSSPRSTASKSSRRSPARSEDAAPQRKARLHAIASDHAHGSAADAKRLAAEMERALAEGRRDLISPEALQALMAAVCKTYAAQVEAGEQLLPLPPRGGATATDVMVTASGLLKAANLAVFELGMWQSWTGR